MEKKVIIKQLKEENNINFNINNSKENKDQNSNLNTYKNVYSISNIDNNHINITKKKKNKIKG